MRDVKVFLIQYNIPKLKNELSKHGIQLQQEESECDTALVIYGDYANPLVFKSKRVLAYYIRENDEAWNVMFFNLFKPVLHYYYDEFINLSTCNSFIEMADRIAREVKRLQNETD